MKDAEDMPVIGSVIDRQQKILQDCTEKKISLVKLQGALLKQSASSDGSGGSQQFGKMALSAEDRKILQDLIEEKDDKDDGKIEGEKYEK